METIEPAPWPQPLMAELQEIEWICFIVAVAACMDSIATFDTCSQWVRFICNHRMFDLKKSQGL